MQGIDEDQLAKFIRLGLEEDTGSGDHTSLACILPDQRSNAKLIVKDVGVIAGVELAKKVFKHLDENAKFITNIEDGKDVKRGDVAFELNCNTRSLLRAERFVLNAMQRMSGIATMCSRFAIEVEGIDVKILDTRKTSPTLRFLEKWAVRIGGCLNYRDGLYDRIMIKDNHIDACGSIKNAILNVNNYLSQHDLNLKITVEVRNLVELYQVLEVGNVDRIMFDNFELPLLREAVATVHGRFETEASGGIRLNNVRKIAKTGVDFISVGALTHSAGCLDLSLKIKN